MLCLDVPFNGTLNVLFIGSFNFTLSVPFTGFVQLYNQLSVLFIRRTYYSILDSMICIDVCLNIMLIFLFCRTINNLF